MQRTVAQEIVGSEERGVAIGWLVAVTELPDEFPRTVGQCISAAVGSDPTNVTQSAETPTGVGAVFRSRTRRTGTTTTLCHH